MASEVPVIVFSQESMEPGTKSWTRACDEIEKDEELKQDQAVDSEDHLYFNMVIVSL